MQALSFSGSRLHQIDVARTQPSEQRAEARNKRKALRHPGKTVTEPLELPEAKQPFVQQVIDIMKAAQIMQVDHSATEQENPQAYQRRAERVVNAAEVQTLKKAITTADELTAYCAERNPPVTLAEVGQLVLDQFV